MMPLRSSIPLPLIGLAMAALAVATATAQEVTQDNAPQPEAKQVAVGDLIVVVGAGGTDEYETTFAKWADLWKAAAAQGKLHYHEVGRNEKQADAVSDREELQTLLRQQKAKAQSEPPREEVKSQPPLWLVLIGHGTYDRKLAKFNLRGPDCTAKELSTWLADCARPLVLVHSFSTSGAFLDKLTGQDRVVITATKSGAELNYSRFGGFLAESLSDKQADLDHDDQVSLLEAYLLASSKVARFYEEASRLATEHALLEDNNDGKGTTADFFVGIRAEAKAKGGARADGLLAHRYILVPSADAPQLTAQESAERDRLESEIETLRAQKDQLNEDEYYRQLEVILIELAELYEPEET